MARSAPAAEGPELSTRTRVLLFLGVWTLLGLFFASRSILIYSYSGDTFDWRLPLKISLVEWWGWALLAPFAIGLAHRFGIERRAWPKALAVHLGAGLVVAFLKVMLDGFVQPLVGGYSASLAYKLHTNLVTYGSIVAVVHATTYYRKYRERELRASQLETRLAQAQLRVLKSELHPHFLFNTLHAISTLMHRDAEAADRMLARLSDLLRHSLDRIGEPTTSLKDEIEFLDLYLEIEKMRFGERLSIRYDVDADALDVAVPSLVLQPLVENAIRHAVAPRSEGGAISIEAKRADGRLRLVVSDDGPGVPDPERAVAGEGIGLSNTKSRLEQLYGAAHRFELSNRPSGGLSVTLEMPAPAEGSGE